MQPAQPLPSVETAILSRVILALLPAAPNRTRLSRSASRFRNLSGALRAIGHFRIHGQGLYGHPMRRRILPLLSVSRVRRNGAIQELRNYLSGSHSRTSISFVTNWLDILVS